VELFLWGWGWDSGGRRKNTDAGEGQGQGHDDPLPATLVRKLVKARMAKTAWRRR
jgi:hypothetical protein